MGRRGQKNDRGRAAGNNAGRLARSECGQRLGTARLCERVTLRTRPAQKTLVIRLGRSARRA